MMDNRKKTYSNNIIKVMCTMLQKMREIKRMLRVSVRCETRRHEIMVTLQHVLKLDTK